MEFKPTPSQREAITTTDCHLAVTAGAGSGKTRVLVERYLNLLGQGIEVEEIAAITFTKKAAQEMKDRLCQAHPGLISQLERAQISTIHSLCQRIIQEHPLEAAVDPRFRVGEEWEAGALLLDVISELMEQSQCPAELGNPSEATDLVGALYSEMLRQGDLKFIQEPEPFFEQFSPQSFFSALDSFLGAAPDTEIQKRIMDELKEQWPALRILLESSHRDLQLEALEVLDSLIRGLRGNFAALAREVRTGIELARKNIEHDQGMEIVSWLGEFLAAVHAQFNEKKRLRGILDFNDLEHLAYQLLQNPKVRSDYRFKHLMVDEFQDTNPLQKRIVDCLTAGGALLFVVGDPKQSIYRFRGADVGVFLETRKKIEQTGKNVYLAENFRSRPELIEFANNFFPKIMGGEAIPFEESSPTKESPGEPGVTLLCTPAPEMTLNEGRTLEAEQIALKIKELVSEGRYRYRDISVLFRVMTNVHLYEKALQAAGVPYVNLSGRGFYSKQEIQDVLNYFRWLGDFEDRVARSAVLRSPFYLISDDGLYWLMQDCPERLAPREQEAWRKAQSDYSGLLRQIQHRPAPEVISEMLERTGYLETTWRLAFGPQKTANVEKLLKLSWELFARDLISVPEQLRYIELMSKDSTGEGEALLDAEHADVVVLRTIHGAKGLEFPVGFIADTNGGLTRSRGGRVLYHPHFGLHCRGMQHYDTLREQELQEEISESKRLLYVAFTRAEEEVFWCCLGERFEKESWWAWLREALPELPGRLYTHHAGTLSASESETLQTKSLELEIPSYSQLPPQYGGVLFSVTSLLNYVRCPYCFYLRYILGVPEGAGSLFAGQKGEQTGISAVQRGNIVHRVCEQIRHPRQLAELLDYAAAVEGVELDQGQRGQIEGILRTFLASEFFLPSADSHRGGKVYREREFLLPAGKYLINGIVDQVFVSSAHLEIVDFKSNWIRADQVQKTGAGYLAQLRLYAWAMAREFGLPAAKCQAYFLIPNQVYPLDPSFLDSERTEQWIIEICREITGSSQLGAAAFPPGEACWNCQEGRLSGNAVPYGENKEDSLSEGGEELM